jgi:hypothetical protein
MTHLANADVEDPADLEASTWHQLDCFDHCVALAAAVGAPIRTIHAANSSGTMMFPRARRDLVRVGIAMYGNGAWPSDAALASPRRQAMRIVSHVAQLRRVEVGARVGYGGLWTATRPTVAAVIPIGYADGVPRRLTGVGQVVVAGRRCPLVGAVSMDIAIADVTDLAGVAIGDEVVVLWSGLRTLRRRPRHHRRAGRLGRAVGVRGDLRDLQAGAEAPRVTTSPPPRRSVGAEIATGVADAFRPVVRLLDRFGDHMILLARSLAWLPRRPFRPGNYLEACEYIGVGSLPIVLLVGFFTGAVMGLQAVYAFRQFQLESFAGGTTGKALAVELAPVLSALMLAGRSAPASPPSSARCASPSRSTRSSRWRCRRCSTWCCRA